MVNQYEDIVDTEISSNTEVISYTSNVINTVHLHLLAMLAISYDGDRSILVGRLQYCTMEIDTVLALNTVRWRSVRYTVY